MPAGVSPNSAVTSYFSRSQVVRDYALARANGRCENCDDNAPFVGVSGLPFLEVHHILRLSDGGPDAPNSVAAICPNCHREAHYGKAARELNSRLHARIRSIEKVTFADFGFAQSGQTH
jgi:5-methylcytosine-specific restriction protein A